MISAFGVEHGEIAKYAEIGDQDRYERGKKTAVVGGTAGAVIGGPKLAAVPVIGGAASTAYGLHEARRAMVNVDPKTGKKTPLAPLVKAGDPEMPGLRRGKQRGGAFDISDAPRPSGGAEFGRGLRGGALGSAMHHNIKVLAPAASKVSREKFRNARKKAVATSTRPTAMRAGITAGRTAAAVVRHPNLAVETGLLGGATTGAVIAQHHKARRNVRSGNLTEMESDQAVAKGVGQNLRAVAPGIAAAGALGFGLNEVSRQVANRRGANVGFVERRRHPLRSRYKIQAATMRAAAESTDKTAGKFKARAEDPTTPPHKAELARVRYNNSREAQRYYNWASSNSNQAAIHGARNAKKLGLTPKFDRDRRDYRAPETIGKSAFGVDHRQ